MPLALLTVGLFATPLAVGAGFAVLMAPVLHRLQGELGSAPPHLRWRRAVRGAIWAGLLLALGSTWPILVLWLTVL